MANFGHAVYEVARKEMLQLIRTKRLLGLSIAFVLTLVLLTIVVPLTLLSNEQLREARDALAGQDVGLENGILLFFLTGLFVLSGFFYIQLLPILLTADAVSSEWSNRTIFLLLSKPVSRTAMVVGKFLGSSLTVAVTIGGLLVLDYLVLQPLIPGSPGSEGVGRFFGAIGLIVLGIIAYSALALLCSTLTRSTVAGMLLAVTAWIIILPLLSQLDLFVALARHGTAAFSISASEAGRGWSQYLSPGSSMRMASDVLVPGDFGGLLGAAFSPTPGDPWIAALALAIQAAVFLGLSLLVVRKRNFE